MRNRIAWVLLTVAFAAGLFALTRPAVSADPEPAKSEFASTTIDLGVVVADVEKSVKFYTEAIGFKEIKGFSVPGDFCADAGLTDRKPLDIRVLVLGDGPTATKIKLMQVAGTKKGETGLVHSQLGYRYLTLHVNDTDAALARLKKAGVTPAGKSPVPLPEGFPKGIFLTVVPDPDGNLVELVGPKKS
jgi:catechol 2,3-dioxygenase-like lactoylglutathione lyase family enzyme